MAKRNIVKEGDEILRKKAKEVEVFDSRLGVILDDMKETMYANDGVGLAGNQIGLLRRIFVVDIGDGFYEFVNPVIVKQTGSQIGLEGCLSVEGQQGKVERPKKLTIKAKDRNGNDFEIKANEFFAVAICHEYDHLDGILFTDKVITE